MFFFAELGRGGANGCVMEGVGVADVGASHVYQVWPAQLPCWSSRCGVASDAGKER